MPSTTQHGSRVVYVAGLSADLPDLIQAWLNEHPTQQSHDIYDALATLTARQRPVALIVNIEAVDWQEMDFFDIAARTSRDTRIYVVGQDYHRVKLEAAIAKGARRFSADDLAEDLARPAPGSQRVGVRDLLAGSLGTIGRPAARQSAVPRMGRAELVLVPTFAEPTTEEPRPSVVRQPTASSTRSTPAAVPAPPPAPAQASIQTDLPQPEPTPKEPATGERPNVRLVGPVEEETHRTAEPEKPATPFPWAPSPSRPKRIPPASAGSRAAINDPQPPDPATPAPSVSPVPAASGPTRTTAPLPVELTAEELAALMGKPSRPESTSIQGRQG